MKEIRLRGMEGESWFAFLRTSPFGLALVSTWFKAFKKLVSSMSCVETRDRRCVVLQTVE